VRTTQFSNKADERLVANCKFYKIAAKILLEEVSGTS